MIKIILLQLIALFTFNTNATVYVINPEHSKINFQVDYMSISSVEGKFKTYAGKFEFDELKGQLTSVEVKIDPKSVDTNDGKRDFHLKGHEFFFAANYPEIIFKSTAPIVVHEKKKNNIKGILEMRGIKKEVTAELLYKGKMVDPWGKDNLFFESHFNLNRQDFGMKWNKELDRGGLLVGDNVVVTLLFQAQKMGEKIAFSTHMIPSTKGIVERDQLKKGKIKKLSTATDPKK